MWHASFCAVWWRHARNNSRCALHATTNKSILPTHSAVLYFSLPQTEPFHATVTDSKVYMKHVGTGISSCQHLEWHWLFSWLFLMLGRTQLRWFMRYRSKVCVRAFDTCKARAASSSLLINSVACNMMTSLVWNNLSCEESTRREWLVPVLLRRTPSRADRRSREDRTGNTTQNRD